MVILDKKKTLTGLLVKEAMRKQVIHLPQSASIDNGIRALIKFKINAFLIKDENGLPTGVVSKTDIMGAYYASLPLETPLNNIMSFSPLFCRPNDTLESALDIMKSKGIYRLYVIGENQKKVVGTLAYPDIVGLLYLYCNDCEHSHFRKKRKEQADPAIPRYKVKEVMTSFVKACGENDSLLKVMEELSAYRFGAVLITDKNNHPSGVISKTDLSISYKHGVDSKIEAKSIMSSPVLSCEENELLEDAIKQMIFTDIHRLFVYKDDPQNIVGVFSLSDAARVRSGSCHACLSSRIKVDKHD
jgi:predicted transcriptional regulator